ncbi:MAG: alpha/beta fold hydrolase [Pseudomonadales bacterium]
MAVNKFVASEESTFSAYPSSRFVYTALEPLRLPMELIANHWTSRLQSKTPTGDGHPVMVLPPFMASDQITQSLRSRIERWGYDVHGWELGINAQTRNSDSMAEALKQRRLVSTRLTDVIAEIADNTGRAVSLIGWSLGGLHALEVAQARPDCVRQIITLGSPLGDPRATAIYALMNASGTRTSSDADVKQWLRGLDEPLQNVPFTCVYSDSDGIVDPAIAAIDGGPQRQNIRVNSTHVGMAFNSRVHHVLKDRLRMDANNWEAMDTPAWLNWPKLNLA